MSKNHNRNYNNYSQKKFEPKSFEVDSDIPEGCISVQVNSEPKIEPEIIPEPEVIEEENIIEFEPEVKVVKPIIGVVENCMKLNIRVGPYPDSEVASIALVNSLLEIDVVRSVDGWYKVCTASGIEGYCMKKFVHILEPVE